MKKAMVVISLAASLLSACSSKNFVLPSDGVDFAQGDVMNSKVDLIIVLDNSVSMGPYQARLAAEIPSLLTTLNQQGLDWHIGVTVTDMNNDGQADGGYLWGNSGAGIPTYVTPATPNGTAILQSKILAGTNGSPFERGLESTMATVNNILNNNPGYPSTTGFWRDDAVLALIVLSDENDKSSVSAANFEAFMDNVKRPFASGKKSWLMNYMGLVSLDTTCTAMGYETVGTKYLDVVSYSGGTSQSICTSSLSQAAQNVKVRIQQFLTDFYIPRKPNPASIKVYLDGVLAPQSTTNGWEYVANGNFIRFHGTAVPGATTHVRVDYDPIEGT